MKTLVYQYWDGPLKSGIRAGEAAMREYAHSIGAEYLFEHNPKYCSGLGKYTPHYGQFKVVYEPEFEKYDKVLFCDTDIFPTDTVLQSKENIFEEYSGDIGICTEPHQPELRKQNPNHHIGYNADEKWAKIIKTVYAVDMPRTEKGLLKVYNSGVVLYNMKSVDKIRKGFVKFKRYQDLINTNGLSAFYGSDQPYLHAMMFKSNLIVDEMNQKWNAFVHYHGQGNPRPVVDLRTQDTNFVHIQLSGADDFGTDKLWRIINLHKTEWKL